jgi:hypothetical protein
MTRRAMSFPLVAATDPQSLHWFDLSWTPWFPFRVITDQKHAISLDWLHSRWTDGAGVYRFRTADSSDLLYVGEALHMVRRLIQHRQNADRLRGKVNPSDLRSSGFDWRLGTQLNRHPGRIEVSWAVSSASSRKRLEADLIGAHAEVLGRRPRWQALLQLQPDEALHRGRIRAKQWLVRYGSSGV